MQPRKRRCCYLENKTETFYHLENKTETVCCLENKSETNIVSLVFDLCFLKAIFILADLTRVVISYEIYKTSLARV